MASDIILIDDTNDQIEFVTNKITIKQDSIEKVDFSFASKNDLQKLLIGNPTSKGALVQVSDKKGKSLLSGEFGLKTTNVETKQLSSENAQIGDLQISTNTGGVLNPGRIKFIGSDGVDRILIDGQSGMLMAAPGDPVFRVDLSGKKVGVGTAFPQFPLHVKGQVAGQGPFLSLSDGRCKQNIFGISDSIHKIMGLKGISFNWKDSEFTGPIQTKEKQYGFIAQEVEKVIPEAVTKDGDGLRSMSYSSIIPLLVEGIKEQQKELKQLQSKIHSQKSENKNLHVRINNLENALNAFIDKMNATVTP